MVEIINNNRRTAEGFKNFLQPFRLLIKVNRNAMLQRKGMEIAMFLPKATG
jgi:hypothetical protein